MHVGHHLFVLEPMGLWGNALMLVRDSTDSKPQNTDRRVSTANLVLFLKNYSCISFDDDFHSSETEPTKPVNYIKSSIE